MDLLILSAVASGFMLLLVIPYCKKEKRQFLSSANFFIHLFLSIDLFALGGLNWQGTFFLSFLHLEWKLLIAPQSYTNKPHVCFNTWAHKAINHDQLYFVLAVIQSHVLSWNPQRTESLHAVYHPVNLFYSSYLSGLVCYCKVNRPSAILVTGLSEHAPFYPDKICVNEQSLAIIFGRGTVIFFCLIRIAL